MAIKIVVSDVDGCITDGKGKAVDAGLLSQLNDLIRENAVRVILCSGRVHPYLEALAQQIGLESSHDPLIVQSGAAFYYPKEDRLESLLNEEQRQVIQEVDRRLRVRSRKDSGWHLEAGRDLTVCVVPDPGSTSVAELSQVVDEEIGDMAVDIHPSDGGVDIVAEGVNKGYALRIVMDRLGIDFGEALGIGDSTSDLTFMSLVGFVGCPANATKPVRRFVLSKHGYCSSFETTEGVIDVLRRYYLGGGAEDRAAIFGVSLRRPKMISDERGKLIQWFDGTDSVTFVSYYELETEPGYLRGNHYHPAGTREELIRVTRGQFTVYLEDLRDDSPTRGVRTKVVLRAAEPHMLRVPSGVAHVLVNTGKEIANVSVHSTEYYQPDHDIEYKVLPTLGYRPKPT